MREDDYLLILIKTQTLHTNYPVLRYRDYLINSYVNVKFKSWSESRINQNMTLYKLWGSIYNDSISVKIYPIQYAVRDINMSILIEICITCVEIVYIYIYIYI